jgi:hypothetical protein
LEWDGILPGEDKIEVEGGESLEGHDGLHAPCGLLDGLCVVIVNIV